MLRAGYYHTPLCAYDQDELYSERSYVHPCVQVVLLDEGR